MIQAGIDAIPFVHPELETWRSNFKGIRVPHKKSGFELFGAVDDLWQEKETGRIIVVDYKATAKDEEVSLDAEWQDGYKRQVEFYQWLLMRKGLNVSPIAWFVYANGCKDRPNFDFKLNFRVSMISHTGNTDWVESELEKCSITLNNITAPNINKKCAYCNFTYNSSKYI